MNRPQWERFKALVEFREKHAERLNKPTYKVIDRDVLADFSMKNDLSGWMNNKRIHPSLKKPDSFKEVQQLLRNTNDRINSEGLTDDQPAREALSHIEKVSHSKRKLVIHQVSEEVLIPIKNFISEKYGEQLSTFILSKRMMEKLIIGELKLPPYRIGIIQEAAASLGINENTLTFLK
jgi:hypothetical protein